MNAVLYMALTVNGMIAREDDATDWVSPTEWKSFRGMIKKAGNMIIGRRTYEVMLKNKELEKLGKVKVVVVSQTLRNDKSITVVQSPREALNFLQRQQFETALICGGAQLNSSFMQEKLIDEIYLDIEPILLGKGIKLFADAEFEARLQLVEVNKLSKEEVQLHYKVKR